MGLILDIVPNHMGVGGADNAWWLDVLEWGRAAPMPSSSTSTGTRRTPALRGKLLAPFLGASYGEVLAAGDLVLNFDADGRAVLRRRLWRASLPDRAARLSGDPAAPAAALDELAAPFARSAAGGRDGDARARAEAGRAGAAGAGRSRGAIAARARSLRRRTTEAGRERLHRLLERQALPAGLVARGVGRDQLAALLRHQRPGRHARRSCRDVFDATHATILRLYAEGLIDGVRIDHVDGLADPRGYCRKLRRRLEAAHGDRPAELRQEPPVIWVEKILAAA